MVSQELHEGGFGGFWDLKRNLDDLVKELFGFSSRFRIAKALRGAAFDDVQERIDAGLGNLAAAVDAVASMRGHVPLPDREDEFDIVDPFKRSSAIYRRSRDELVPAAEVTAEFLNLIVALFGEGEGQAEILHPAADLIADLDGDGRLAAEFAPHPELANGAAADPFDYRELLGAGACRRGSDV